MTIPFHSSESSSVREKPPRQVLTGGLVFLLGCLALGAPFVLGKLAPFVLGLLILGTGVLEIIYGFGTRDRRRGNSVFFGSAMSIVAGLLLLAQPKLGAGAQALLLGLSFASDGLARALAAVRSRDKPGWGVLLCDGLISVLLGLFIAVQWPVSGIVSIGLSVGLRMLSAGWAMLLGRGDAPTVSEADAARLHPDAGLGLAPHEELAKFGQTFKAEDEARGWIDRYWRTNFILIFFAIHVGRMDVEWNLLGFISPGVAVIGDVFIALLLAWGVVIPLRLGWRKLTRPIERRAWNRLLATSPANPPAPMGPIGSIGPMGSRLLRPWLTFRYRFSLRVQQSRRSPTTAVGWGMQIGLPLTAILIALNPIWGMSWYFNTENWATGAWEKWTEVRVDAWREEMVKAVRAQHRDLPEADLFRVSPDGVAGGGDFSFIVIGDTGEGDASQHVLRDRLILLGQRPDVKFLVLSSDVIYPSGAMKDYEPKFYLPFKGFTKPIYAVPGNHDWYDALEAFTANFLEPESARSAIRARRLADLRLTSTNEAKIDGMIEEAARLRRFYGVQAARQRAPFFEVQTDRFALIIVDTGILKTIDKEQERWLAAALERSRGKFKMAILGHPIYAGGRDHGVDDPPFAALHQLLRDHEVDVVMGGDTHYLEYYKEVIGEVVSGERSEGSSSTTHHAPRTSHRRTMHHFVNGGGGAYLSIGTPLDWPKQPAVPDCAFYPRADAIIAKLDEETPRWKRPMWFWVKRLGAWPSTAEGMAAAFDYNRAPFYQSFVEVRVESSAKVVRLIPHGVNGPLRWRELQRYGKVMPEKKSEEDHVEFAIPIADGMP